MARKPTTFMERLEAAKDVIALYHHAQEVRAVLGLLPEFAFDESGMRDGLDDAARRLFQEILLQSKPETGENYGAIFDITDINWSERLKVLRSVADPVATAHERLLKLIAALEVETIAPGYDGLGLSFARRGCPVRQPYHRGSGARFSRTASWLRARSLAGSV